MQLQGYQKMIENVGDGLPPDGDWMPVLFLEKDNNVVIMGIPFPEGDAGKDIAAAAIYATIRMTNPDSVAWLTTAWSIPQDEMKKWEGAGDDYLEAYKKGWTPRASEHPARIEIVNVVCIGVRGENEGEGMMIGHIKRFKDKPPKIIKWDVHEGDDMIMMGRFPEAIKKGFAKADPNGNLDVLKKMFKEQ